MSRARPGSLAARWVACVFAALAGAAAAATAATDHPPGSASALDGGALGLFPSAAFRLSAGPCGDCPTIRQAQWYFRGETIAAPLADRPVAAFTPGEHAFEDVRSWAAQWPHAAPLDYPPLVWVAAPRIVRSARIAADRSALVTAGGEIPFRPVPKIPMNRAYYDASSVAFFASRAVTVRGTQDGDTFVGRTLWPEDFRLGPSPPPSRAIPETDSPAVALRALMHEAPRGGAQSPYAAMTLWQRDTSATWAGRPVLALMVNGAQGDDDEALGGHFAIVTGRIAADGGIGDWLVNNFYSLDVESEKGIIAAPVPLDNYLADLNSGQGWYRPSYMAVAVLRDERAAALVQSALGRVFNQFYRHQLEYYHPNQNCASISIDTLRALGWKVPQRGPTSRLLAWVGFPFVAAKDMSIGKAKLAFDYLRTDQTRLLPAAALEEAFGSLVELASGAQREDDGPLARMLAQDVEAIAFLRFPQFPSSRALGDAPVVTSWEYKTRIPNDPALAQIVPVPPRPFPDELRDPDLLPHARRPSDYAVVAWGVLAAIGVALLLRRMLRRRGA